MSSLADEIIAAMEAGGTKKEPATFDEVDAFHLQNEAEQVLKYLPLLGQSGYLVEGWSHLLAGFPRVGKSELLYACMVEWLRAGQTILYFTEEGRELWRQRLQRQRVPAEGLQLVFALGGKSLDLLTRMRKSGEPIVVIDTIRSLQVLPADENDNAAVARALEPWVTAAREMSKTLILSHHARKGGGEHGEGISGGHALFGAVDVALEVCRSTTPARRIIKAHARLIQPADLLYERDEDGSLAALGDPSGVGLAEVGRRILDVMDHQWAKTADVHDRLEEPRPSAEQLRLALAAEARCGRLERDPPISVANVQGKTTRWRLLGGE